VLNGATCYTFYMKTLILLITFTMSFSALAGECELRLSRLKTYDVEDGVVYEWTEKSRRLLETKEIVDSTKFEDFKAHIESLVPIDQNVLLKRQRAIFQKHIPSYVPRYNTLLNGEAGKIRPINCIESALYDHHMRDLPADDVETEFAASILKSRNGNKLKIIFTSSDKQYVYGARFQKLLALTKKQKLKGYKLVYFLHNHPFFLEPGKIDIAGTVIPSGDSTFADVSLFLKLDKEYGDYKAVITNGFDTFSIKSSDVHMLDRPRTDLQ
jgi:hypothetical protein